MIYFENLQFFSFLNFIYEITLAKNILGRLIF